MDASTFYEKNQIVYNLHINFIFAVFNNLNGAISYNPEQKWYYYSKQNTKEVLVFHQYSKVSYLQTHKRINNKSKCRGNFLLTPTPPSLTRIVLREQNQKKEYQQSSELDCFSDKLHS